MKLRKYAVENTYIRVWNYVYVSLKLRIRPVKNGRTSVFNDMYAPLKLRVRPFLTTRIPRFSVLYGQPQVCHSKRAKAHYINSYTSIGYNQYQQTGRKRGMDVVKTA